MAKLQGLWRDPCSIHIYEFYWHPSDMFIMFWPVKNIMIIFGGGAQQCFEQHVSNKIDMPWWRLLGSKPINKNLFNKQWWNTRQWQPFVYRGMNWTLLAESVETAMRHSIILWLSTIPWNKYFVICEHFGYVLGHFEDTYPVAACVSWKPQGTTCFNVREPWS